MSRLLSQPPYAPRDDDALLEELNELTALHRAGCPAYARVVGEPSVARDVSEVPFVHVGLFKRLELRTELEGIRHGRRLHSSSTTGQTPSRVFLDTSSSAMQAQSTISILRDFLGPERRPLLVLDSPRSVQSPGDISARVAAAMALRPLASDLHFILRDSDDPASVRWDAVISAASATDALLVYGFTWMLWLAWGASLPVDVARALEGKRIHFVHSGGWKKMESLHVSRERLDAALLRGLAPGSRVVDYYGLVEQVGIVYPLCEAGHRHPPRWADVVVRDAWTLSPLSEAPGLLQLVNTLARGAPYHSVLTEDLGQLVRGVCPCGRSGRAFDLAGRVPKSEARGCAVV
jgi:hypothetical protein